MEFIKIVSEHRQRYPLMKPTDYFKLAYQSEYGPEHLITDEGKALEYIISEWKVSPTVDIAPETIGNGLCRFHLNGAFYSEESAELLCKMLCKTASTVKGTHDGLTEKLCYIGTLDIDGMQEQLSEYRAEGCPPIHHSKEFRNAYAPHYRLLLTEYAEKFYAALKNNKLEEF